MISFRDDAFTRPDLPKILVVLIKGGEQYAKRRRKKVGGVDILINTHP